MATFAEYILNEEDLDKKMAIVEMLKRRDGIFYNETVTFKTDLAKLFIETMNLDVDENLVLTACLLYGCQKDDNPQDFHKIRTYAAEGAEYLRTLGFDERFCRICEGHNRYTIARKREYESDLLEVIDQFGAMLLHRQERPSYSIEDAICLLESRNLKGKPNQFMELFKEFLNKNLVG